MKKIKVSKKWLVVILAAVILGTVAVGVAIADSSSATGQSPQNLYQAFLGNLAGALHISQSDLTGAIQTASTQTVNQAVYSGQITQQQANQILSRISKGLPFFTFGPGRGNKGSVAGSVYGQHRGFPMGGGFMIMKPLANALGMTPQALISALRSGQTVSSLAQSKNLSMTQLESTILASIKSQLDQQVQNGRLTTDQETQIYNKLQQSIDSGNWATQLQQTCQSRFQRHPGGQQTSQQQTT